VSAPDLAVVIVSWRTRELTLRCLRSVEAESALAVETVLVDNASDDGTVEAVRAEHPTTVVVANSRNLGFAAGCNAGVTHTSAHHVLFLNPDAEAAPGALRALVRFLDATPRAGAVGARLVTRAGEPQFSAGRFLTAFNQFAEVAGIPKLGAPRALRRTYDAEELRGDAVEVDWLTGACLAVRRAAFDETGGFDEGFFMYGEDEDLCFRLRRLGWTVHLLPGTRVVHDGGQSARQAIDRMRAEVRASQTAFLRKHRGRIAAMAFQLLMRIASLKPRRAPERVDWGR
jgi:GT2 family glycosyltransferase